MAAVSAIVPVPIVSSPVRGETEALGGKGPLPSSGRVSAAEQSPVVVQASQASPMPGAGASRAGRGAALPVFQYCQTKSSPAHQWAMGFAPGKLTPPNWLYQPTSPGMHPVKECTISPAPLLCGAERSPWCWVPSQPPQVHG